MNLLTPPATPSPSALVGSSPAVEAARAYASAARAPATRRAYATSWAQFTAWCQQHGTPSLPADPQQVALYLAGLAQAGRSVSTIERTLASLAAAHRLAGFDWPKAHPVLASVLAGIRRTHGRAPKKKAPLEDRELRAVVATLDDSLRGMRDRALLVLGWFGALRRSELVALRVEDVSFVSDGLVVRIPRSKTDQEGRGAEKGLPYAGDPRLCPVRTLRRWLDAAAITHGPLFRSIRATGRIADRALSDRSVARFVQDAVAAAGLDPTLYGGHSLRAGFATTAARKGKSLDAIMRQTGHKSERVARGYIRHATLFIDNAAAGIL